MKIFIRFIFALALSVTVLAKSDEIQLIKESHKEAACKHWKPFHSFVGQCSIAFPENPEHVTQKMSLEDEDYDMQYDVYVATEQNQEAVFMVLIAQYPPYVTEEYADLSLESFLNGILTQHPNNELVSADLIEVQGHKGMDFFIKTKGVYFKGRAVMSGSNLYLLAMECQEHNYKENKFVYFINSFQLGK